MRSRFKDRLVGVVGVGRTATADSEGTPVETMTATAGVAPVAGNRRQRRAMLARLRQQAKQAAKDMDNEKGNDDAGNA